MTFKILITDNISPQALTMLDEAADVNYDIVRGLSQDTLAETIPGYDGVIIRSSVKITESILLAADTLKVVGRAGVGVDNVDINTASMRGVIVMNTPGANTIATAEHTFGLMLALCRHIPQAHGGLKAGKWDRKKYQGVQLYHKTLGVVGMGRIGTRVASRAQAFGMDVLAYDPYLSDEVAHELKVKLVDLPELLANADFITLHAAHTPQTNHLINADSIAQMKDGVRIINAARGALIDETALADALRSGKVAGAALDVFTVEPLPQDNPLMGVDNVIITPHLAASTSEAQRDVGTQIVEQMLDALRGVDYRNAINMPVADAELLNKLGPYLKLAEIVGSLQSQLADAKIERIEVEIKGEDIADHVKPLTVALLKGMLTPFLSSEVNFINAPHIARQQGTVVSEAVGLDTPNYPHLVSCRAVWDGGERILSATLFNDQARLVQVDTYRLDVHPDGQMLVIHNQDAPGFIGKVGTLLGDNDINIAAWRYGRSAKQGQALSVLRLDSGVPAEVEKQITEISDIMWVKKVTL